MYVCKFEGAKCQSGIKAYLSATGTTVTSNMHRGGKEMIRTYATEKLFSPFCGDESVHAEDCIAAHRLPTWKGRLYYACVCVCIGSFEWLRYDVAYTYIHTSHLKLGDAGGVSYRVFIERSDELRELNRYNAMGMTTMIDWLMIILMMTIIQYSSTHVSILINIGNYSDNLFSSQAEIVTMRRVAKTMKLMQ